MRAEDPLDTLLVVDIIPPPYVDVRRVFIGRGHLAVAYVTVIYSSASLLFLDVLPFPPVVPTARAGIVPPRFIFLFGPAG